MVLWKQLLVPSASRDSAEASGQEEESQRWSPASHASGKREGLVKREANTHSGQLCGAVQRTASGDGQSCSSRENLRGGFMWHHSMLWKSAKNQSFRGKVRQSVSVRSFWQYQPQFFINCAVRFFFYNIFINFYVEPCALGSGTGWNILVFQKIWQARFSKSEKMLAHIAGSICEVDKSKASVNCCSRSSYNVNDQLTSSCFSSSFILFDSQIGLHWVSFSLCLLLLIA